MADPLARQHQKKTRRSPNWLRCAVISIITLVTMPVCDADTRPRSPERPNFIIILADDMGYGDSSVYNGWIDTPHLERMAREGLTFTDFHTSGVVCSPTRAGLITGRYQQRAGIPGVINADPKLADHYRGIQSSENTFAEALRECGYQTAIFGKWHLGYLPKYNPIHHGFDQFVGFVSGNIDYLSHYDRMEAFDWWRGTESFQQRGYLTHLLTEHAVEFVKQHKQDAFCLFVSHGAVHSPIQAPDSLPQRGPNKTRVDRQPTRSRPETVKLMMRALDESVGKIIDAVSENGIAEKTFVIFLSDNGGAGHMRCDPLRGKKGSVWEGGHRVPAIFWWPGTIRAGTKSNQLCSSLDIMPTMLQLCGARPDANRPFDGVSLDQLMVSGKALPKRSLFWNGIAMRDGPWKLVTRTRGLQNGPVLFNLDRDLSESSNVANQHPERVDQMLSAIQQWKVHVQQGATRQPDYEKFNLIK